MAPQGNIVYPFTAMVGQEKMRSGLILLLINPALGGLLIQGVEALEIARLIAAESRVKAMVIDVEKVSSISFGVAHLMAGILGATYNKIEELKAGFLVQAVKKALL